MSHDPDFPLPPGCPPTASLRRIQVNGTALEVLHLPAPDDQAATRAPLVFLHEGLGSVGMWAQRGRYWPAEVAAATGRAAWVYSRRGYGQSEAIADVRGAGRHAPDYMHREARHTLPALLEALGVRRPILVGHSDGATVALLHASTAAVTACAALAPHVMVEDVALRAIEAARQAYLGGGLRERLARYHADVDSAFWQWNDVWLSDGFRTFDMRSDCARITCPLLLVQGVDDEYGTLAQLDEIERAAPHARRLVLGACGHSPHRDQPDAVTHALQIFLNDLP